MEFSPKLKRVMAQIKAILDAEDVAGLVVLHTPGYSEYLQNLTPSYSCMKWEQGGRVRFLSKLSDYNGNAAAKRKKEEDTSNMLNLIGTTAGHSAMQMLDLSKIFDKQTGAEHSKPGHRPHNPEDKF